MSVLRCKNINELQYCSKQKTFVFWGDERLLNENLNDFFFSELKNIHRLILQLEIKIGKAMLSEAPTQHSFHHTDSIKVCKQIKEVSFGM